MTTGGSSNPAEALRLARTGAQLAAAGRLDNAMAALADALRLDQNCAEAWFHIGNVLFQKGLLNDALGAFSRSRDINPNVPEVWNNLGSVLERMGRRDDMAAAYRRALELDPANAAIQSNFGRACYARGEFDPAIDHLQKALSLNPQLVEAEVALGLARLLQGDLLDGWNHYEARRSLPKYAGRTLTVPAWDGGDLAGRKILLRPEQGFGDSIQFARYAPMIAKRGGRVLLSCHPELKRVFGTLRSVEQIVTAGEDPGPHDRECWMMSLPGLFRTTLETIPADIPYLSPDPTLSKQWAVKLAGDRTRPRIGVVWAGGTLHTNNVGRSLSRAAFQPLLSMRDFRWISLQKGALTEKPPTESAAPELLDWTDQLHDFADTAALIDNLDLVISADTAVAHLAGAMGKPVWLAIPFVPDWRWLLNRSDSPWYPSMRLFRQPKLDDWDSVIRRIAQELPAQAASLAKKR